MEPKGLEPSRLPRLAVTLGDPTGVGPEIIADALRNSELAKICQPFVIGRPEILEQACKLRNHPCSIEVLSLDDCYRGDLPPPRTNTLYCISVGSCEAEAAPHARIDPRGGQAAYDALVAATKLALQRHVDAIVTAPLHKAALHAAGHHWPGHTELLAHLCGVTQFAMMLYLPPALQQSNLQSTSEQSPVHSATKRRGGPVGLGVVHVTLHMALRDVFAHLSTEAIFEKIALTESIFRRLRMAQGLPHTPSIAVAALNPHGGEEGLFGDEEITVIRPAVELAKARGWNVKGPLPVDTLMPKAADGDYDGVVAMYHDQGHIALKLLDMFDAVNITLGLPILRTSVAHGTAHDQAWQGTASSSGMVQAIRTAAWLASHPASKTAPV